MNMFRKKMLAGLSLVLGVVIGIGVAAELGRLNTARAVEPHVVSEQVGTSSLPSDQVFVDISKRVTPAVVNISTTRRIKGGEEGTPLTPFFNDPFFKRFFGDQPFAPPEVPKEQLEKSLGSGVIVDPNGYIVTNNHVISGADEIKVVLADRREFKGKVVGSDPKSDVAVVKIDAKNLPTVPWGDSSKLQVGEYVLAVGNPFGLNQTVTMGIVSAVGRANVGIADYEDFIQTDAAINPGNSGGALVNVRGELIGINTAIFTRSGGYMGIGFAVPSSMAKSVMESLIKTGKVVRGWFGISIQEVTPGLAKQFGLSEPKGVLVGDVLPKSPAERAGIKRGDVILKLNGEEVENTGQLRNLVAEAPVGSKVKVDLFRDKQEKEVEVTIGEQPKEIAMAKKSEEGETTNAALRGVKVENLTADTERKFDLPKDVEGVVIVQVEPGSAAQEAGLQRGDVIVEVDRKTVRDTDAYDRIVSKLKKDEEVLLLINRQGRTIFLTISAS
ncbi:MAG TPA: DegQ family serine endoprotease [Nitrospiria bacterium]|nr:DegQ family serine endoprotease [Nitrospiria bacterium]